MFHREAVKNAEFAPVFLQILPGEPKAPTHSIVFGKGNHMLDPWLGYNKNGPRLHEGRVPRKHEMLPSRKFVAKETSRMVCRLGDAKAAIEGSGL